MIKAEPLSWIDPLRRASFLLFIFVSACLLAGCGRRGPLQTPNPIAQSKSSNADSGVTKSKSASSKSASSQSKSATQQEAADQNDGIPLEVESAGFGSGGRLERDTSSPLAAKITSGPSLGPPPQNAFFLDPLL